MGVGPVVSVKYARARHHGRLWVVTTLFNPAGYKALINNYRRFADHMAYHGVNLLTAELLYAGQKPTLSGPNVIRAYAKDVMWHKERLLNLAIERLPDSCDMVAWIDADVLFNNPEWVKATERTLENHPVAQMFEKAVMLDPEGNYYRDAYGYAFSHRSGFLDNPGDRYSYYNGNTKHPGFAWAARRDTIVGFGGLYDQHILGGADFHMALSMTGDFYNYEWYGRFGPTFQNHMRAWARNCHEQCNGDIGYVPGSILHLWHGHAEDRQYVERSKCLVEGDFDPDVDLKAGEGGMWEWSSYKPEMHRKVADYFSNRNDDTGTPVHPTRHEDKYPLLLDCRFGVNRLRQILTALSHQGRTDFCVFAVCPDWAAVKRLKPLMRNTPWPFEIRIRGAYGQPSAAVPRRLQVADQVKNENRAKKCLFVDDNTVISPDFVNVAVRSGKVVVDCRGALVCVDSWLLRLPEIQKPSSDGEERVVTYAVKRGIEVKAI